MLFLEFHLQIWIQVNLKFITENKIKNTAFFARMWGDEAWGYESVARDRWNMTSSYLTLVMCLRNIWRVMKQYVSFLKLFRRVSSSASGFRMGILGVVMVLIRSWREICGLKIVIFRLYLSISIRLLLIAIKFNLMSTWVRLGIQQ